MQKHEQNQKLFPRRFLNNRNAGKKILRSGLLLLYVLYLAASSAFTAEAELTNLVIRNRNDELQIDLTIKGIFTDEMKMAVSKGVPVSLTFLILLYEVRDYWFDDKLTSKTAIHEVKFDNLKKEYRIRRSWENMIPLVIKDFEKAKSAISIIRGFDVIPLTRLKKDAHYQLRVKSELIDQRYSFSGTPWKFETDWYTINFIY